MTSPWTGLQVRQSTFSYPAAHFWLSLVGADHSLHSSDGIAEDEDDLAPLERARQRRNIFFKR